MYTSTVKQVDEITEFVRSLGHPVARYHGQLGARERKETQDRFMAGELRVIVATNAFGMGIDKPDIRFVVHYNMPGLARGVLPGVRDARVATAVRHAASCSTSGWIGGRRRSSSADGIRSSTPSRAYIARSNSCAPTVSR